MSQACSGARARGNRRHHVGRHEASQDIRRDTQEASRHRPRGGGLDEDPRLESRGFVDVLSNVLAEAGVMAKYALLGVKGAHSINPIMARILQAAAVHGLDNVKAIEKETRLDHKQGESRDSEAWILRQDRGDRQGEGSLEARGSPRISQRVRRGGQRR